MEKPRHVVTSKDCLWGSGYSIKILMLALSLIEDSEFRIGKSITYCTNYCVAKTSPELKVTSDLWTTEVTVLSHVQDIPTTKLIFEKCIEICNLGVSVLKHVLRDTLDLQKAWHTLFRKA